jgi:hypothetical protein
LQAAGDFVRLRMLKGSGKYLRNQTIKNAGKAFSCTFLLALIITFLIFRFLTITIGFLDEILAVFAILPLAGFFFYLRKYHIYRGGWEGEKRVTKLLRNSLNDDYYLINNLRLRGYGDVDHVVLGPNGVFVLETKNWSGKISCNGDFWQRQGNRHVSGSPSEQAKKNAAKVRHAIDASGKLPFSVWLDAIVVFTNNHAELHMSNPTVPILNLRQIANYITSHGSHNTYSKKQLETIGKIILNQNR